MTHPTIGSAFDALGFTLTEGESVCIATRPGGGWVERSLHHIRDHPLGPNTYYATGTFPRHHRWGRRQGRTQQHLRRILELPFDFDLKDFLQIDKAKLYTLPEDELERAITDLRRTVENCFTELDLPLHRLDYTGYGLAAHIHLPPHEPDMIPHLRKVSATLVARINARHGGVLADKQVVDPGTRVMRLVPCANVPVGVSDPATPPRQSRNLVRVDGVVELDRLVALTREDAERHRPRSASSASAIGGTARRPPRAMPEPGVIDLPEAEAQRIIDAYRPFYRKGHKHLLALGIAGQLAKAGVPEDQAIPVVSDLAQDDEQPWDRTQAVRDTYARWREGLVVSGYGRLRDVVPEAVIAQVDLILARRLAAAQAIRSGPDAEAPAPNAVPLVPDPLAQPATPSMPSKPCHLEQRERSPCTESECHDATRRCNEISHCARNDSMIGGDYAEVHEPQIQAPPVRVTFSTSDNDNHNYKDIERESGKGTVRFRPELPPPDAFYGWHGRYRDLVAPTTEAADAFHIGTSLAWQGALMGRRISMRYANEQLFPSMYHCLVGPTGNSRKDTAVKRILSVPGIARRRDYTATEPAYYEITDIGSREALIGLLARHPNLLLFASEMVSLFKHASRDATATLLDGLINAWDVPPTMQNNTLKARDSESNLARDPFLTIIGGIQPERLAREMTEQMTVSGLGNRIAFFMGVGKERIPRTPAWDERAVTELYRDLMSTIQRYTPGTELWLDAAAGERWDAWYLAREEQEEETEIAADMKIRHPVLIQKWALCFAVSDGADAIGLPHLEAAISLCEWMWRCVQEALPGWGVGDERKIEERILTVLRQRAPMQKRQLNMYVRGRWTATQFAKVFRAMEENEQVVWDASRRFVLLPEVER